MPTLATDVNVYSNAEISAGTPADGDFFYYFDSDETATIKLKRISFSDLADRVLNTMQPSSTNIDFTAATATSAWTPLPSEGRYSTLVIPDIDGAANTLTVALRQGSTGAGQSVRGFSIDVPIGGIITNPNETQGLWAFLNSLGWEAQFTLATAPTAAVSLQLITTV